ncbi:MAG: hypothetical protein ACOYNN_13350, partial [Terrimicrobiaceae bacterium]
ATGATGATGDTGAQGATVRVPRKDIWFFERLALLLGTSLGMILLLALLDLGAMARYTSPLYIPLVVGILASFPGNHLSRTRWWNGLCIFSLSVGVILAATQRQRPLWPISSVIQTASSKESISGAIRQLVGSYTFSDRWYNGYVETLRHLPTPVETVALTLRVPKGLASLVVPRVKWLVVSGTYDDRIANASTMILSPSFEFSSESAYAEWLINHQFIETYRSKIVMAPDGSSDTFSVVVRKEP